MHETPASKPQDVTCAPPPEAKGAKRSVHTVPAGPMAWVRLGIQLIFLVMAPQAFSAAFAGARSIVASVAGGLSIDIAGFVATSALLCMYTVIFGRFFCGFACAFGTVGDVLYNAGTVALKLLGKPCRMMNVALENKLRWGKYIVLALVLLGTAAGAASIITALSPWTAFGRLLSLQPLHMGIVGSIVLVCMCVLMVVKERAFCEFLCPLGAIFSLLPQLPWVRMKRDQAACTNCAHCQHTCPVSIYPPDENAQMGECIQCERCLYICPESCVSTGGKRSTVGGRIARAVGLAVLLFALLWLCDSVNFLPSLQDLFLVGEA